VHTASQNGDNMIDEVVLRIFTQDPINLNYMCIKSLLTQLGGYDNSLDTWKQKNLNSFNNSNNLLKQNYEFDKTNTESKKKINKLDEEKQQLPVSTD